MKFEFIDQSNTKYEFDFSNYGKNKSVLITCHLNKSNDSNFLQPYLSNSFERSVKNKKVLWFGNDLMLMSISARVYCQKIINNMAFL